MILFLSKYPQTEAEFRDGFFQRVESIDHFFHKDERVYLHISMFKHWKKQTIDNGIRKQILCNLWLHFFYILGLFKASSVVYVQSIYNAVNTILFILLFNKKYVLDLHGVVPEELQMKNKKIHVMVSSIIEYILFQKVSICIAVTNRMVKHYQKKYPKSHCKFIVYAILPSHLGEKNMVFLEDYRDKLEIIYSGNTQVWQNIDLMLQSIKNNLSENIHFTILTGEPSKFIEKMNYYALGESDLTIKSVKPEELANYYKKSHYGFVLRDDILVNRVACPTKIIEYLAYGITPIVLSEKIGDFEDLGYEYIFLNQLEDRLPVQKSLKNIEVIQKVFKSNNFDFRNEILKS